MTEAEEKTEDNQSDANQNSTDNENITQEEQKDTNFLFASSVIKLFVLVIAIMIMIASKHAFIFFTAAMMPAIFAIFLDRNTHKYLSATICSFNLIGVMPYLALLWGSNKIDYLAKNIIANIETWLVIYGVTSIGQMLYIFLPLLIVRLYSAKMHIQAIKYEKQYDELVHKWDIESKNQK